MFERANINHISVAQNSILNNLVHKRRHRYRHSMPVKIRGLKYLLHDPCEF